MVLNHWLLFEEHFIFLANFFALLLGKFIFIEKNEHFISIVNFLFCQKGR